MQYIAMERNNSFFLLQCTMKGELVMSIKSQNLKLEKYVDEFSSLDKLFEKLKSEITDYQNSYNAILNMYDCLSKDYINNVNDTVSEGTVVTRNGYIKNIGINVEKINTILSDRYGVGLEKSVNTYMESFPKTKSEYESNGYVISNVQEIIKVINKKTSIYNQEIGDLKSTYSNYYQKIISEINNTIDSLEAAKSFCLNFEIEIDGSKKIKEFRHMTNNTKKLLLNFGKSLKSKKNQLDSLKIISVRRF